MNHDDLKKKLGDAAFNVTQNADTEAPFSGKFNKHDDTGIYHCICCDAPLFRSDEKFDSGSGWPSYWAPVNEQAIKEIVDASHGMRRVETRCAQCDAHLGHVFEDGPQPSGLRYCINSASLDFTKSD